MIANNLIKQAFIRRSSLIGAILFNRSTYQRIIVSHSIRCYANKNDGSSAADGPRFADFTQMLDEQSLRPPVVEGDEVKYDSKSDNDGLSI
jgi:hypothetical protein